MGWVVYVDALGFHADEAGQGRFIFEQGRDAPTGRVAFNPVRRKNENRPDSAGDLDLPNGELERYVGAFVGRRPDGGSVWLILWTNVFHETESGDLAPGLGGFTAETDENDA